MKRTKGTKCKCGCGGYAQPGRTYILGHALKGKSFTEIHRQRLLENKKKFYNKPEAKSKLCECGCGKFTKPGNNYILGHNQRGKPFSQEHKDKVRKNRKGIPVSLERRQQISETLKKLYRNKENHPRWQGGLSLELYGEDFNSKVKQNIRKNDAHFCQLCGESETYLKEKLCIHHIDYNKQNNNPNNFISLCRSCHAKTNTNRTYWKQRLRNMRQQEALDYSKAILCGDFHLREDTPVCRTDTFLETQIEKLSFIKELQKEQNCPVVFSGDLFHHWKSSPYLITIALNYLPENMWVIAGNHDLPNHSIELLDKSALGTLIHSGAIHCLQGTHWLNFPEKASLVIENKKMLVWHIMTWKDRNPIPGSSDPSAKQILKKYPQYDIIVTGHNHATFVEEYEGRLLVNPGSITRQTADQENHRPCVFLWYEESNTVEQVFLKCSKGVVSRKHIEEREDVDARIATFVDKLNSEWQAGLSFEENLERFRKENKVSKLVMDIIYNAMEKSNGR
jgi:putative phosphoesterase